MSARYFGLQTGDVDPLDRADDPEVERMRCINCTCLLPGMILPVIKVRREPTDVPMTIVRISTTNIVRLDLLDAMGLEARKHLHVAPLVLENSQKVRGFFNVQYHQSVHVRGGPLSTMKGMCKVCNLLMYWPRPLEEYHIPLVAVKDQLPIYAGWAGATIIREDVYESIKSRQFPHISFCEYPVVEHARDGLPDDLPSHATPEFLTRIGALINRDIDQIKRPRFLTALQLKKWREEL